MVQAMRAEFADLDLTFSIGGQISFDLFPTVRVPVCFLPFFSFFVASFVLVFGIFVLFAFWQCVLCYLSGWLSLFVLHAVTQMFRR